MSELHGRRDVGHLARGGSINVAGSLVASVLGFALVVVVARVLHAGGAGLFFEAVALFSILAHAAELGADTGAVRHVARARALGRMGEVRGLLVVALVPVLAVGTAMAVAVYVWAPTLVRVFVHHAAHPERAVGYVHVLAFFIPLAAGSMVLLSATRGLGTMVPYVALENVGKPLLRPLLTIAAIGAGLGTVAVGLAWALPVALEFPVAALAVALLLRRRGALDRPGELPPRPLGELAKEFWRFSAPRGMAALFQISVLWLDVLLVGALRSSREAGIYAAVSRLAVMGILVLEAVRAAFAPQLSDLLARGERERAEHLYQVATTWVIASSWPLYLAFAVFAPLVLRLFGPGFAAGQHALLVLSLAMLVNLGTGNVTVVLLMGGKSWWNLANTMGSLSLNVALNLLLIPRLGITGAAIAWAASILFENLAPLVQVSRLLGLQPFGPGYAAAAGASLACVGGVGLAVRLAFGTALGPAVAGLSVGLLAYGWLLYRWRDRLELPLIREGIRRDRGTTERPQRPPPAPSAAAAVLGRGGGR